MYNISPHITKTNSDGNETTPVSSSSSSSSSIGNTIDIGLLSNPNTTGRSYLYSRVTEYLVFHKLKRDGHSMERHDKVGWGKMYTIMTGKVYVVKNKMSVCSNFNKYWVYQHGGRPGDLGYDIHPLDQKIFKNSPLSINNVKDMGNMFRDAVLGHYGISFWTTPTTNIIKKMMGLDEVWKDFALVLGKLKDNPKDKKNQVIIQHLKAETGYCPSLDKGQWANLAASPARQTEFFNVNQCFKNILLELGGGDHYKSLPSKEEIPKLFGNWMSENPDMVDVNEATNRLSFEQNKLVAAVSNNFKPSPESVHEVDKEWLDSAPNSQSREFRLFVYKLRYKYGKNRTPIPPGFRRLVDAATAPDNMNMYLMMFDLHHNGQVAIEQKRRDKLLLGRSNPSHLYEQELNDRAHLFELLPATEHAFETWGEIPAMSNYNSKQYRSRSIKYNLVEELEMYHLGPRCTMSREVLPGHIVDGHHDAEGYDIKEGSTVHPTAKVCNRRGLYLYHGKSESWLIKLFKEVLKKTRLKKEWHRFLHFVLGHLDWFKERFETINYPYEVRGGKLVRLTPIESGKFLFYSLTCY